ncbi:MAG: hypothetical protein RL412_1264 [Pseudomonadota bacterium]|jgi:broad specificity phosphatase PhoE
MPRVPLKCLLSSIVSIGLVTAMLSHTTRAEDSLTSQPTVVIVVRHAEKLSDDGSRDPPLSAIGQERAHKLVSSLRDVGIRTVYASDTRRAQETAEPIAASLGLVVERYPGREVAALIDRVLKNGVGQTVLVVGHSNTVPEIISRLTRGSESVVLRDDEYDAMFIVTIGRREAPALLRLRY